MNMKENRVQKRILLAALMTALAAFNPPDVSAEVPWHLLIRNADGTVRPAPGYGWDGDPRQAGFDYGVKVRHDLRVARYDDRGRAISFVPSPGFEWVGEPNNLVTRVNPGLVLVSVNPNGSHTFRPAAGYVWDGDPQHNGFAVRVRPDLRVARYDARGVAVSFFPATGYVWVGHPDNLVTQRHPGLIETATGFRPASGYAWLNPNDPDDFSVAPAPGYEWASRDRGDLSVRHMSDSDGNRSPAFAAAPFVGRVVRGVFKPTPTSTQADRPRSDGGREPRGGGGGGGGESNVNGGRGPGATMSR
jgi:hypothetical protein